MKMDEAALKNHLDTITLAINNLHREQQDMKKQIAAMQKEIGQNSATTNEAEQNVNNH